MRDPPLILPLTTHTWQSLARPRPPARAPPLFPQGLPPRGQCGQLKPPPCYTASSTSAASTLYFFLMARSSVCSLPAYFCSSRGISATFSGAAFA